MKAFITCIICSRVFDRHLQLLPKRLCCNHEFCLQCCKGRSKKFIILCPVCFQTTIISHFASVANITERNSSEVEILELINTSLPTNEMALVAADLYRKSGLEHTQVECPYCHVKVAFNVFEDHVYEHQEHNKQVSQLEKGPKEMKMEKLL